MLIVNPSGWVWLKAQTLSAIAVISLCSVALPSFEAHEAKLAVPQMLRTAIRNQVFNLFDFIIVSVLYLKSATNLLNFQVNNTKITHLHYKNECFFLILCNFVTKLRTLYATIINKNSGLYGFRYP
jgi:hypothetical protein